MNSVSVALKHTIDRIVCVGGSTAATVSERGSDVQFVTHNADGTVTTSAAEVSLRGTAPHIIEPCCIAAPQNKKIYGAFVVSNEGDSILHFAEAAVEGKTTNLGKLHHVPCTVSGPIVAVACSASNTLLLTIGTSLVACLVRGAAPTPAPKKGSSAPTDDPPVAPVTLTVIGTIDSLSGLSARSLISFSDSADSSTGTPCGGEAVVATLMRGSITLHHVTLSPAAFTLTSTQRRPCAPSVTAWFVDWAQRCLLALAESQDEEVQPTTGKPLTMIQVPFQHQAPADATSAFKSTTRFHSTSTNGVLLDFVVLGGRTVSIHRSNANDGTSNIAFVVDGAAVAALQGSGKSATVSVAVLPTAVVACAAGNSLSFVYSQQQQKLMATAGDAGSSSLEAMITQRLQLSSSAAASSTILEKRAAAVAAYVTSTAAAGPPQVVRDASFWVGDSHLVLDSLLKQHHGSKNIQSIVLRYLFLSTHVSPRSILRALLAFHDSPAFHHALCGSDATTFHWASRLAPVPSFAKSLADEGPRVNDGIVHKWADTLHTTFLVGMTTGCTTSVENVLAVCDALCLVHSAAIIDATAQKMQNVCHIAAEYARWALQDAAVATGVVSACCGADSAIRKESMVIPPQARRINFGGSLGIYREVIKLKGEDEASQHPKQSRKPATPTSR